MSASTVVDALLVAAKKARRLKQTGGAALGEDVSRAARRLASAILEVLAGARTPAEAATALAVSLPRYYQVESRALQGLLKACEAKPQGRAPSPERELAALRRQNERLQRDVSRQQALVRAAQRTMGLPPPHTAPAKSGKKTRQRRVARALNVAARLQADQEASLSRAESASLASAGTKPSDDVT
jgi:hypothetical protein